MSEPSAITGLPDPHVATHAVGMPDTPRCTLKPYFSSCAGQVLRGLDFLEAELAEAEDGVDHLLRELRHLVDASDGVLLVGVELGTASCAKAGLAASVTAITSTVSRTRIVILPCLAPELADSRRPESIS